MISRIQRMNGGLAGNDTGRFVPISNMARRIWHKPKHFGGQYTRNYANPKMKVMRGCHGTAAPGMVSRQKRVEINKVKAAEA